MSSPTPDAQLIDALGGHRVLAAELGIEPSMVWNWQNRRSGVAADWRPTVADLARRKRIKLPPDFLLPAAKRARAA